MCLLISGWMYVALVFFLLIFMYAREEAVSHGHIPVNAAERERGGEAFSKMNPRQQQLKHSSFHRLTTTHASLASFFSSKALHWTSLHEEGWKTRSFRSHPSFFRFPNNIRISHRSPPHLPSSDFKRHTASIIR